jgi:ABC-2 type transport system permease protein
MQGDEVVWQDYNPYPRAGAFVDSQWVFIDEGCGAAKPFNPDEPIVSGLRQVLFLLAGSFQPEKSSKLDFAQLAVTGSNTGVISHADLQMQAQSGGPSLRQRRTGDPYIMAARVSGELIDEDELSLKALKAAAEASPEKDAAQGADESADGAAKDDSTDVAAEPTKINVVLVADIDCLADPFFAIREMGDDEDALVDWNFQNVAFVLNALDALAGDDRFLDVRKRTRQHRILSKIEEATEAAREEASKERSEFIAEATKSIEAAREEFAKKIAEIEARTDIPAIAKRQMIDQAQIRLGRARDVKIAAQEKERNRKMRQAERDLAGEVRSVQDFYKLAAVVLPPIPPILLAFFVFFHRREREREGVSKSRMRFGSKEQKPNKPSS